MAADVNLANQRSNIGVSVANNSLLKFIGRDFNIIKGKILKTYYILNSQTNERTSAIVERRI